MTSMSGLNESSESELQDIWSNIDNARHYTNWYAIGLPSIGVVGIVVNMVSILVLGNRKNRSLSTLIMCAQLLTDIAFLICLILITCAEAWAFHIYGDEVNDSFWLYMEFVQKVFMGTTAVLDMARSLTIWYALALILEQFFAFQKPLQLTELRNRDGQSKTVVTIMCTSVLVHIILFFKYVRREKLYSKVAYKRVCLSDSYLNMGSFELYDVYIYYILFYDLPWLAIFIMLIVTAVKVVNKRKADNQDWEDMEDNPAAGQIQEFKSGRSLVTIFSLTVLFLLFYGGVLIIHTYMYIIGPQEELSYVQKINLCQFFPIETKYFNYDQVVRFWAYLLSIIYAVIKFPVLLVTHAGFRTTLKNFFKESKKTATYSLNLNSSNPGSISTLSREAIILKNLDGKPYRPGSNLELSYGITPLPDDVAFVNSSREGPCMAYAY